MFNNMTNNQNRYKAEQIALLAMPTQTSKPIILESRTLKQFPVRGFPDGLTIYQTGFSILQKQSFLLKLKGKLYCATAFMIQL